MPPRLSAALAEAEPLIAARGWVAPTAVTIAAAERLLALVATQPRPPAVQVEPDGTVSLEWEAAGHGWLTLTVDAAGRLAHGAVIGEDEFTRTEDFDDALPPWADTLLTRLLRAGH